MRGRIPIMRIVYGGSPIEQSRSTSCRRLRNFRSSNARGRRLAAWVILMEAGIDPACLHRLRDRPALVTRAHRGDDADRRLIPHLSSTLDIGATDAIGDVPFHSDQPYVVIAVTKARGSRCGPRVLIRTGLVRDADASWRA